MPMQKKKVARDLMKKVKQDFPLISYPYGDLWILASVAAIQVFPFPMYCYVLSSPFSYRKWLVPRFLGARGALTVSLPSLHFMDVSKSLKLLRARTTSEVSLTTWGKHRSCYKIIIVNGN